MNAWDKAQIRDRRSLELKRAKAEKEVRDRAELTTYGRMMNERAALPKLKVVERVVGD